MSASSESCSSFSPKLRLVFVGTGVSTAIPTIAHAGEGGRGCACDLAIKDPNDKNNRNNVSLVVQEWTRLPEEQPHDYVKQNEDGEFSPEELERQRAQALKFNPAPKKKEGGGGEEEGTKSPAAAAEFGWGKTALIDMGKTFRASYFKVLVPLKIFTIDALVLTHEHADAIMGCDDARDLQKFRTVPRKTANGSIEWIWELNSALDVFCSPFTLQTLTRVFGYIFRNSRVHKGFVSQPVEGPPKDFEQAAAAAADDDDDDDGAAADEKQQQQQQDGPTPTSPQHDLSRTPKMPHGGSVLHKREPWKSVIVERRVAALDLFLVDEDHGPFRFAPEFTPAGQTGFWYGLPCEHGANYLSLGFIFGVKDHSRVVYISDVSKIDDTTLAFLQSDIVGKIDVLIMDCLLPFGDDEHFSHFGGDQFWRYSKLLDPKAAYGVGMWCSQIHEPTCEIMAKMLAEHRAENPGCRMETFTLAHDGLVLEVGH